MTDEHGIGDRPNATVWAGMQDASLATRAKVQYLAVTGPATIANALPFLASLIQRRRAVIIATGDIQTQAARQYAPAHPQTRFVLVGTDAGR